MENKSILTIKEFGPINKAEIEIDKINIITGVNATGKSTLSKVLYSLLTTVSLEGDYITNENIRSLFKEFIAKWSRNIFTNEDSISIDFRDDNNQLNSLLNEWSYSWVKYEDFMNFYKNIEETVQNLGLMTNKTCKTELYTIKTTLKKNKTIHARYIKVLQFLINQEIVLAQTHNNNTCFSIKNKIENEDAEIKIAFKDDYLETKITSSSSNSLNFNNTSNIIYIDSPSVLDITNLTDLPYHYKYLFRKIKENDTNIFKDDQKNVMDKFEEEITGIINGKFRYNPEKRKFEYLFENKTPIDISNTASGYKQIGIIQLLLSKSVLKKNSLLIIDEPELNLHQELQVKFAQLLVKMSKELDIKLYINSHSPIFIEAIELYTAKYDLMKNTKFYLAQKEENNRFYFENIERNHLTKIYSNIGHPYDNLDELRGENIVNGKY